MNDGLDLLHPAFELACGGRIWRAAELAAERARLVGHFAQLGDPGAVVRVPAADPATLLAGLGAAWLSGRVPLPDARADVPRLADLPATDAGLVLRTSGSTGAPRFAAFERAAVGRGAARIARYLGLSRDDRVAVLQPLEHGFGLVGQLLAAAVVGARAVWAVHAFADERAAAVRDGRATVLAAVPFVLAQLLDHAPDPRGVRAVGSAGGALSPALAARLGRAFPEATVWNQYGCTEAGPRLAALPSTDAAFASGAVGRPIEGVELRRLDNGQIAFRTDAAMRGYLGDAAATAAARAGDGFWRTGDLGEFDLDGNLRIVGRADDVVKVRGMKVSLQRVAQSIEACGARAAVVVLLERADAEPALCAVYEGDAEVTRRALAERLPLESLPATLRRIDALPRLTNGKIHRVAAATLARQLVA